MVPDQVLNNDNNNDTAWVKVLHRGGSILVVLHVPILPRHHLLLELLHNAAGRGTIRLQVGLVLVLVLGLESEVIRLKSRVMYQLSNGDFKPWCAGSLECAVFCKSLRGTTNQGQ